MDRAESNVVSLMDRLGEKDLVENFKEKMGVPEFEDSEDLLRESDKNAVIYDWDGGVYHEAE